MMTIGNMTGANNIQTGCFGRNVQTDSVSKNLLNQIANAQKKLQELSSNEEMTLEEKMKKRQEIQQEISNLNQQLRQHQIEQRKEQQSKDTSMDDMLGGNQSARTAKKEKGSGLSQASMQAMILADSSMKQAQVQGGVAARMEGRAGVLKAEIKQDAGGNTEAKEAELAEVEKKAMNAAASQINTLASANQAVEEAAEAKQGSKAEKTDTKTDSKAEKADKNGQETGKAEENTAADTAEAVSQPKTYTPVDIRL